MKRTAVLAVATAAVLGACGGAQPAATPSSAAASTKPASSSAASVSAGAVGSAAAGGLRKVVLAYSSISGDAVPQWVAKESGIFEKNGLDLTMNFIAGAPASVATLVAGQAQFAHLGGAAAVAAAAGGADLAIIGNLTPVVPYQFYVGKNIKTAADLKGQKIDIGSTGSAIDLATRLALPELGLEMKDVVPVRSGSQEAATKALLNGAVQARMLNPPSSVELDENGFKPLLDLAARKLPSIGATIVVSRAYLAQNHDIVQRYVDSLVQGEVRAKADKAYTISVLKKYFKLDDDRAMEAAYAFWVQEVLPVLPFPPKTELLTDAQKDLAATNPDAQKLDVTKLADASLVQSAADRGLDKR